MDFLFSEITLDFDRHIIVEYIHVGGSDDETILLAVRDYLAQPLPGGFDPITQTLTITEERRVVADTPSTPESYAGFVSAHITGYTTVPPQVETLAIIWNITNASPVAWTDFVVIFGGDINTWAYILDNTPHSDTFPDADISLEGHRLEFSGPGVVLPGELLTIEFDVALSGDHPSGTFGTLVLSAPVPEPTSLLVLGCGAVMLLRKRRYVQ
ncbi:MAG TPA: PEP-CTERM sorting domain-containing protein [Phycisphaerales bacterium]|nr:PEP-CTERM sorting domain-containing protein [Phycisphaerales bacterium]